MICKDILNCREYYKYSYPNIDIHFIVTVIYDQIMDTQIMNTIMKLYILNWILNLHKLAWISMIEGFSHFLAFYR